MSPARRHLVAALVASAALSACTRTVVVREPEPQVVRGPSTAATLGVPPGHLPRPGECRIWIPGTPPGRQPGRRSRSCEGILRDAPAGSWVIYRPTRDRRLVHVRLVDERRPGVIIRIRVFEVESGRFVRDEEPDDERPRDERPQGERPSDPEPREERPREDRGTAATLDIPAGHLPEPGECRIWIPGMPPGRQRHHASRDCDGITREAPAGSWIVYRPTSDRKLVHIRVVDDRRSGVIVRIRIFEVEGGRFVREENP